MKKTMELLGSVSSGIVVSTGDFVLLEDMHINQVMMSGIENIKILFSKDNGATWYNKTKPEKVSEIKTAEDNGITVVCTAEDGINYSGWRAFDGQLVNDPQGYPWQTYRNNSNYVDYHWVRYDFGENNTKVVDRVYIQSYINFSSLSYGLKDYSIEGSNDGADWEELIKDSLPNHTEGVISNFTSPSFINTIPYRYIRINLLSNYQTESTLYNIYEIELYGQLTPTPISDISTQGLTPTRLLSITKEDWNLFMGDSNSLRLAFYLPYNEDNIDNLEMIVSGVSGDHFCKEYDYEQKDDCVKIKLPLVMYQCNPLSCYKNNIINTVTKQSTGVLCTIIDDLGESRSDNFITYSDILDHNHFYLAIYNKADHYFIAKKEMLVRKEMIYRTKSIRTFFNYEAGYQLKNGRQNSKLAKVI